jgi:hypothetical protein
MKSIPETISDGFQSAQEPEAKMNMEARSLSYFSSARKDY